MKSHVVGMQIIQDVSLAGVPNDRHSVICGPEQCGKHILDRNILKDNAHGSGLKSSNTSPHGMSLRVGFLNGVIIPENGAQEDMSITMPK